MACNSCAKSFTLLRKEKGCPSCGFSYCSKCLCNKVFLTKLNSETKVCAKCKQFLTTDQENGAKRIEPPDAYYRCVGTADDKANSSKNIDNRDTGSTKDQEMLERLNKLKQDKPECRGTVEKDIARRLQNIKGDVPSTSDAELHLRLAKLRGLPETVEEKKPVLPVKDLRPEQEQVDDLMKQYLDQTKIDTKYKEGFDESVNDIETRMQKLKESSGPSGPPQTEPSQENAESEDEEEIVKKIVEKVKAEASLEDDISLPSNDELPFCEICNEDAKMRCLGCRYLFCKRCFLEHKDDDDGCNKYEAYDPTKGYKY